MKRCLILNSYYTKLFLYVITASLTALLADLQHYICRSSGEMHLSYTQLAIMIINFLLQGLIAWRAFIDDSSEKKLKEGDVPHALSDNLIHETRSGGSQK
jgi:hypothetical protein